MPERRKGEIIALVAPERVALESLVDAGREPLATRARFVLLAARGLSAPEIAASGGCSTSRVRAWLARFRAQRVEGLADRPRSGAPSLGGDGIERLCTNILSRPPDGHERWNLRELAGLSGMSHSSVRRWLIRHDFDLDCVDLVSPGGSPPYPLAGLWLEPPVHVAVLDSTGTGSSPFGGAQHCPRGPAVTPLAGRLLAQEEVPKGAPDEQWREASEAFLEWFELILQRHGDRDLVVLCDCAVLCGDPRVCRLIESASRANWLLSPRFLWWHRFSDWTCLPPERAAWEELRREADRWVNHDCVELKWCRAGD